MEKKVRILFISLTFLAVASSTLYHTVISPPKSNLTLEGPDEVARVVYEQEWEKKYGGEQLGLLIYYIEKYKLYRKLGKFGKYFRKRKKSK